MTMSVLFSALGIPLAPGVHVRKADGAKISLSDKDVRQIYEYQGDALVVIGIEGHIWEIQSIRMAN
jgi:hypothetical protein